MLNTKLREIENKIIYTSDLVNRNTRFAQFIKKTDLDTKRRNISDRVTSNKTKKLETGKTLANYTKLKLIIVKTNN